MMTIEVTPGSDAAGHVHAHVVMWLPWVDYRELAREWSRATDGSDQVDVAGADARGAARYIAKYLSKGLGVLPPRLAASWYEASYGRRRYSASRRWWQPRECPDCHVPRPRSLLLGWHDAGDDGPLERSDGNAPGARASPD